MYLTLLDPMDCSLPGSSIHGIFQARVLKWVAISFSRGSSWPRDWTQVSHIASRRFTIWATREVPKELDHKEGWALKNRSFRIEVLEKTLESPLDCKDIQPVHPKGNQPWIFIERTDTEAEAPVLWPPDAKSQLFGKDPDAGKDWRQKEKGVAADEMVR